MLTPKFHYVLAGLGAIALGCVFFLLPMMRGNSERKTCQTQLKFLALALNCYRRDWNDSLPLASGGALGGGWRPPASGWTQALSHYTKSDTLYRCPSTDLYGAPTSNEYTAYWFNARLSGVSQKKILAPSLTLVIGEGGRPDNANSSYNKSSFPASWLTDRNSPAWRHRGGANYVFVDGHIKWLRPNEVTTFGGRKDAFALR